MAEKHDKPQGLRNPNQLPKAGPKSASGGKNRGRNGSQGRGEFDRILSNRTQDVADARRARAQARTEQEIVFARKSDFVTKLVEGSPAHTMAFGIIDAYADARPFVKDGKVIKDRIAVASVRALKALPEKTLAHGQKAIQYGRFQARKALEEAIEAIKAESQESNSALAFTTMS